MTPLWSSGHSCWLQIQRSGFDSGRYQIFLEVVDLERGPLSLVSTIEDRLHWRMLAPYGVPLLPEVLKPQPGFIRHNYIAGGQSVVGFRQRLVHWVKQWPAYQVHCLTPTQEKRCVLVQSWPSASEAEVRIAAAVCSPPYVFTEQHLITCTTATKWSFELHHITMTQSQTKYSSST
jgi:hypothetical protein